jgi:rubrerythrin
MDDNKKTLVLYVKAALFDLNKAIKMYDKAALEAHNSIVKNFYTVLVEEKKNHYKYIQRFYQYVDKNKDISELSEEIERLKQENQVVFSTDFIERINKQQGVIGALSLAIEHEKKAMVYYQKLFTDTQDKLLKRFFEMMFHFIKQNFSDFMDIFQAYEEHSEGYWEGDELIEEDEF